MKKKLEIRLKKIRRKYKSVIKMVDDISKSNHFKNLFKKVIFRKKLIEKITKVVEDYTKPVHYYLNCEGCKIGLAEKIYDLIEKEFKKNGK